MKSIVLFAAVLRIILITTIIGFVIVANVQSVAVNTTGVMIRYQPGIHHVLVKQIAP